MTGWRDGWNGWMVGRWIRGGLKGGWMTVDELTDGCGWMDGWVDEWVMDGRMEGVYV